MDAKVLTEELAKAIQRFDQAAEEVLKVLRHSESDSFKMSKLQEMTQAEREVARLSQQLRELHRKSRIPDGGSNDGQAFVH